MIVQPPPSHFRPSPSKNNDGSLIKTISVCILQVLVCCITDIIFERYLLYIIIKLSSKPNLVPNKRNKVPNNSLPIMDHDYRELMNTVIRDFENTGRTSLICPDDEERPDEIQALRIMSGDEGPELKRVLQVMSVERDHQLARLQICKYVLHRKQTMSFIYLASEMEPKEY